MLCYAFAATAAILLAPGASGYLCAQAAQQRPVFKIAPVSAEFAEWQKRQGGEDGESVPPPFALQRISGSATQFEAMVKAGMATFPPRYDLRDEVGHLPPVRDQSSWGTCWAFGTLVSLESAINKGTGVSVPLSEWHLAWSVYKPMNGMPAFYLPALASGTFTYNNKIYRSIDRPFMRGGHFVIAVAAMVRGSGPALRGDSPYQSDTGYTARPAFTSDKLPTGLEPAAATIKDAFMFSAASADVDLIKSLVFTYGAVDFAFCLPSVGGIYYNPQTYAYRVPPESSLATGHESAIVGWDDSFPKGAFPAGNQPASDGAWIVRNSWGPYFGQGGYFYVAYDLPMKDAAGAPFGAAVCCFVADLDLDYKIYQHDYLGKVGEAGYGGDSAWFANAFDATGDELIRDVSLWSSLAGAEYEITIRNNVTGNPSTGAIISGPHRGTLGLPGYHRVRLGSPARVNRGDRFAVVARLREPGGKSPIAIQTRVSGYSNDATSRPGAGWLSPDGASWIDATSQGNVAVCLKAFAYPSEPGVTITNPPSVLLVGDIVRPRAYVQGLGDNMAVQWSATAGNFQDGRYIAPDSPQDVTITASSGGHQCQMQINVKGTSFDGNSPSRPRLLGMARAFGSTAPNDLEKYDLNGDGRIDNEDYARLFKKMGWAFY